MTVNEVIASALNELSETMPETFHQLVKDQNFITLIQDEKNNKYVLVDFTRKMVYHEELFAVYSMNIWDRFNSIDKFYDC